MKAFPVVNMKTKMDKTIPDNGKVLSKEINLQKGKLFVELQVGNKVIHQEYRLLKEKEISDIKQSRIE